MKNHLLWLIVGLPATTAISFSCRPVCRRLCPVCAHPVCPRSSRTQPSRTRPSHYACPVHGSLAAVVLPQPSLLLMTAPYHNCPCSGRPDAAAPVVTGLMWMSNHVRGDAHPTSKPCQTQSLVEGVAGRRPGIYSCQCQYCQ